MTLQAAHLRLPLQAIKERAPTDTSALRPPRIGPPQVADELELNPIREIALRELLSHASGGTARLYLPLVASKIKKGPFSIEIPAGAEAVIDLVVEDGRILRDKARTRGTIVPEISLPLGLKFRGIFLDDDGSVIADISRFPNIKLSWLNVAALKIPATLEDTVALLIKDKPQAGQAPEPPKEGASLAAEAKLLRVEARDATPRAEPLSLGDAGYVTLGPETRLDVDYSADGLEIGGHVEVPDAELSGAAFRVTGLRAVGAGSAALHLTEGDRNFVMEFRCDRASISGGSINLLDGSRLELGESSAEDVEIVLTRARGAAHFHVSSKKFRGKLVGGVLMTWIGRKIHPVALAEMDVEGAVSISDRHFNVDVEVRGASVELHDVMVPLGVAYVEVASLDASGSGRFRAGTASGYSFAGALAVNARLAGGRLVTGPVTARFIEGTHVALNVTNLAGNERLEQLEASGTIELALASGSIPVGPDARLKFSRGAVGTLALHSIALSASDRWPRIEAGARFTAASDALNLEDLVELPPGIMNVELPHITLEANGDLGLRDLTMQLSSDDS